MLITDTDVPEKYVELDNWNNRLENEGMKTYPNRDRLIFLMIHLWEYTFEETAKRFNVSIARQISNRCSHEYNETLPYRRF